MKKQFSKLSLLAVLVASLVASGVPTSAEAGPKVKKEAPARVNGASGGKGGNSAKNSGNKNVSGNNVNVGNKTTVNNNRNTNVNVDRDVNVNVDTHGNGRYDYDDHHHPIATAAAVTATVVVTAAVVGSIVQPSQMPTSGCVQVISGNTAYMQCGSTWYQPQYQGSNVTYIVVNQPH